MTDFDHLLRLRWPGVACWALLLGLAGTQPAMASDASQRALAIHLFEEGDRLMVQGKYAAACPKLAESHRLDPQLGVLLYLSECHEKNGQLASAWGGYHEAEEMAVRRGDPRAVEAGQRAQALEPRLGRMVFAPSKGSRPPGYELRRDDMLIVPASWGTAIPVDHGDHQVTASAPGYEPWSTTVSVQGDGVRVSVKVPALVPLPAEVSLSEDHQTRSFMTPQRIGAIAVGGVGLIAMGVGGYFALSARGTYRDSEPFCTSGGICSAEGVQMRHDANADALVASVSGLTGGVAIAVAAVLWFASSDGGNASSAGGPASGLSVAVGTERVTIGLAGGF